MKKVSILFLLMLSSVLVLNSCGDVEKIGSDTDSSKEGTLQVDFDGQTFVSTTAQAIVNDENISITGLRAPNGDLIKITVPANKVGTYTWKNFDDVDDVLGLVYTPPGGANSFICVPKKQTSVGLNYSDTGSLTITSIDNLTKKISGTFQFTGVDLKANNGNGAKKMFTRGVFTNITFKSDVIPEPKPEPVLEPNLDPTLTSNTFSVKLDGVAFVPASILAILQNERIYISVRKESGETIELFLPSAVAEGTYAVVNFGMDFTFLYNKDMTAESVFSGTGSLTITRHDISNKIIEGTFSSKYTSVLVADKHNATEGSFRVSY
jgi:hypothetical protein